MVDICGYEFQELVTDPEAVSKHHLGVYVVVCLISGHPHCVLYIGTSEGGTQADVTPTGNLQQTLRSHEKKRCWENATHGEIGYFVKHVSETERRVDIRDELQWKYITPCGTDPWEAPQTDDDWSVFENNFGPRGSESL